MLLIHTYIYNTNNKIILPNFKDIKIIIWNIDGINKLLEKFEKKYLVYFTRLILNKSRENFIKYLVLYKYGGLFINIELLKSIDNDQYNLLKREISNSKNIVLWINNETKEFTKEIFEIYDHMLNDDILFIRNSQNIFVDYLLKQIDINKIPQNEWENKICLGNVFLSKKLSDCLDQNSSKYLLNFYLEKKISEIIIKKSDIEIKKFFPFDNKYKIKIYPNVPNLLDPEKYFNSWDKFFGIKKYIENILIYTLVNFISMVTCFTIIIILSICHYLLIDLMINKQKNKQNILKAEINNKIYFDNRKYKFLKNIKKNWKIIKKEAIQAMNNSPKLDISRTVEEWYDSKEYIDSIKNEHGWIKSWSYDKKNINDDGSIGNQEWLNYGLLHFGEKFTKNIEQCPETFKLLDEIKEHINICGFSWMFGGCVIHPHKDITGLNSGSLALHLGLLIPKPEKSCCIFIKDISDNYTYIEEEEGKMFIFDATFEHYAYNQTNKDRLILYIDFKAI